MASYTTPVGRTTTADPYSRIAAMDRLIELSQARFMGKPVRRLPADGKRTALNARHRARRKSAKGDGARGAAGRLTNVRSWNTPNLRAAGAAAFGIWGFICRAWQALGIRSWRPGQTQLRHHRRHANFLGRRMVVTSGHRTARHIEPA